MNEHQVKGRVEQAKGTIKEVAGKAVGNERLQGEGMADKTAGKAQASYGDAKENLKDGAKKAVDKL
ncbi:CsbD family protein [Xylophilus rhododendri]|uniref:CsbD family protein n=1 Tax=Xylophilus rhododendri TaxID=2697032 RepID=A0A857JB71_9BURK|nr:CsbD family protein [Xylophilus rhododendri]QHJ01187.1 CsbD family protein [Xylophilus rhododendri]